MRQRGWLDTDQVKLLVDLFQFIPGPADLTRFMLRHVEDEAIVGRFHLFDEFERTYKGKVKQWFDAQGVPEEVARYIWGAHWQNMPFGQLAEMKFRLRPDKVGDAKDPAGYPYAVTDDDLFQALRENDVPPFWRYKLIELKFRLPRLIDVRRAYFAGVIDDSAIRSDLLDRGISPESADLLLPVYRRLRRDQLRRHRVVRLYQSDAIGEQQARAILAGEGFAADEVSDAISWADVEASAAVTARCVKQISVRFTRGEIPRDDLPQALLSFGLSPKQVARVVQGVTCTLATKPKDLTAANICEMHGRGVIDDQTALDRLARLGYSADDAARMFAVCGQKEAEKKAKKKAADDKKNAAKTKGLTQSQLLRLLVKGELTADDVLARLMGMGMSQGDAEKLIAAALAPAPPRPGKK